MPIFIQRTDVDMVNKDDYKRKKNKLENLLLPPKDMDISMPESSIRLDHS